MVFFYPVYLSECHNDSNNLPVSDKLLLSNSVDIAYFTNRMHIGNKIKITFPSSSSNSLGL